MLRREQVRRRPFFFDPYYPPFRETQGLGSGLIIDAGGTVLTNHHVVDGTTRLSQETGLAAGDVLLGVNNQRVHTAREAAEALRRAQRGNRSFVLVFERGGRLVRTGMLTWRE